MREFVALFAFLIFAGVASADRPVTEAEKARLVEALAPTGCTGGELEFDDGKFEVEKATCADGKTYDLVFDSNFSLIGKTLED